MIAKISTIFNTTPEVLWKEIRNPKSLKYVSAPILSFTPKAGINIESDWQVGKEYSLNLYLFKYIPLGSHEIVIKSIDTKANEIISKESGLLAKTWNHTITFNSINSKQINYTDSLEKKSGIITIFVWLFAHIFYRHRQRKWRKLLLGS